MLIVSGKHKVMTRHTTISTKKSKIILFVVGLLVVAAAVVGYSLVNREDKAPQTAAPESVINYEPATEDEKQQAEDAKDRIVAQQEAENSDTPTNEGRRTVDPVITYAGTDEVNAFISGVVEDGGTCTLTASQQSKSFTRKSSASRNASTTDCAAFTLSSSDFNNKGEWSVTVSYSSPTSTGTSKPQIIEVK
jgi:hypothetical protein